MRPAARVSRDDGPAAGLSVCYVAPGNQLLTSAGPTRNVLSLAQALSRWTDVTVAFRHVPAPATNVGIRTLEIEPGGIRPTGVTDDAAMRGVTCREFLAYLKALRRFVREHLVTYDVVLEKNWLMSGYLSACCRRLGIPAIPIENLVPVPGMGARRGPVAYAGHGIARWLAGRFLRSAPVVVSETEYLKKTMTDLWSVPPHRIRVIGMGVDRQRFRPVDQREARNRLGVAPDPTVLLYVGVLDRTHDLGPLLEAFTKKARPGLELHVVGDGFLRSEYESRAGASPSVLFHGRRPHEQVPTYIAMADVCVAPYDRRAFPSREIAYSTLKVREYLSAGRPVASVPSGAIAELVRDGRSGFLFENTTGRWGQFLRDLPPREQLGEMGRAAAQTPLESWDDIALAYRSVLEEVVADSRSGSAG
jgi:glycosyltransferase involved in cell wall biosynthesis